MVLSIWADVSISPRGCYGAGRIALLCGYNMAEDLLLNGGEKLRCCGHLQYAWHHALPRVIQRHPLRFMALAMRHRVASRLGNARLSHQ
jgi:hypothetical protein